MEDPDKLKKIIKKEINKLRNLGEHARKGSDHLYYRSLSKFKLDKLKKIKEKDKLFYEIICIYDIYTETEFLHTSDMDELYTEHYKDKFVLDQNFNLVEVKDIRKKK
ncbi:MAG: hypothetical protein ACFE85_04260 [Candidatus Hodarchaeota archaeon]